MLSRHRPTGCREGWTVSDQNQWPKPGESSGGDDGRPQQDRQPDGQQSGTPQSDSQQGSPSARSSNGNPYAQPSQDSPYGQGQQSANPYTQPQQSSGNPYAQQQQPGNPYGQQQHNPYAQQSQQGNPYAQQQPGNPYAQQQQSRPGNPYAASGPQHNPYAPQQGSNPYASPYATAGYQPYAQRPKTNTMAILSIVFSGVAGLSLLTFVFAFFAVLAGPAGAILGHLALGKTKATGESGRGLALAGIIVGWVATGIALIGIIVFFVLIANSGGGYSDPYDYDSGAFIR
ncbi:hypothetical protein C1N91_15115 [Curtobacterium sp. SGAir0471]|nr:hypothetical protein C1N91_15115 [Curtobacterium sp. SGAir0471]